MVRKRSAAREWIESLPAGEFFFASEVPGASDAVKPMLSRLAADPRHPVERQMRGFYCKAWSESRPERSVDGVRGALKLAGPGTGGAGLFAVHQARWTYQHPCRKDFAALGRPPSSPWATVRFVRRSNRRREALSPAEVTVIEAIRYLDRSAPIPWGQAMDEVLGGDMEQNLGHLGMLRADAIRWVAENEHGLPSMFHQRIDEFCDALSASAGSRQQGVAA